MALKAKNVAPNFAPGNYYRIVRATLICAPGTVDVRWEIVVNFYASEEARRVNSDPMYQYQMNVPTADLKEDPLVNLYGLVKEYGAQAVPPLFVDADTVVDA